MRGDILDKDTGTKAEERGEVRKGMKKRSEKTVQVGRKQRVWKTDMDR